MLKAFEDVQKQISRQIWKATSIDNFIFRLHYRLTFWALLTATVLVSSRQYIGEHIRCISDTIAGNVINTFCFFTATFTIPRFSNDTQVPHPGVGPLGRAELEGEPVKYHNYYQWVPFVLFGQALMFYLPHLLWRATEGGTIRALVKGLELGYVALADHEVGSVPSRPGYLQQVGRVRTTFVSRLELNRWWGHWLMGCELLNMVNLVLQLFITNSFLGGDFLSLGPTVAGQRPEDPDPLDMVFPKVTKCTFTKYGPTGTIQSHDALCVMALNVINEKIYTFLWFWFVILGVFTLLGMVWRLLTLCLHHRSTTFNKLLFDLDNRLDPDDFEVVISRCDFSPWLFLYYLCKNMHVNAKVQLFRDLASELSDRKSNGYHNRNTLPLPLSLYGSKNSDKGRSYSGAPSSRASSDSGKPTDPVNIDELDGAGSPLLDRPHSE